MANAFVIGSPIAHSLSPEIFRFLSRATGVNLTYERREILPSHLSLFFENLALNPHLIGFNITRPHKEAALLLVDGASEEARHIGAVNVVRLLDGKRIGYNTDALGILQTLKGQRIDVSQKPTLVMGAGGAARAAAYALARAGSPRVVLFNHSADRVRRLIDSLSPRFSGTAFCAYHPRFDGHLPFAAAVNATPVPGFSPLENPEGIFHLDLAYGATQVHGRADGLDVLIWQALATWELWFQPLVEKEGLYRKLKEHLKGELYGASATHRG